MISDATPQPAFLTGAAGALPSRTVAVLEAIKHAILAGELKPGRPLIETDLATVLGVSKTPVREALKTLAGAGLVTMHPYRGAVVRVVDDEQARHIYDLRLLLEPEALVSAAAWRHDPATSTPSWEREAAEHRGVLAAAETGDPERAAHLLHEHITSFVQRNFPAATAEPHQENHG